MKLQRFLPLVVIAINATLAGAQPKPKPAPTKKPAPAATKKPAPAPTLAPTPTPEPTPSFQTWALLVGVSKYLAPQITSLNYPAADATAVRDAMVDPKLGNIPKDHVRLLTDADATGANIQNSVDDFLQPNVKAGDHVVIFLAGHGVAKGVGANAKSWLLPTDVRGLSTPALESSAVNLKTLADKIAQLPAAQFVQFVDACREDPTPGRAGKSNALTDILSRNVHILPPETSQASSVTFFACGIGQRAFEDPQFRHGVFTYWILDGIKSAAIARRPDGAIDMGELRTYVSDKVQSWAKNASQNGDFEVEQTPQMISTAPDAEVSSVVLMRVRRALAATTLPAAPPEATIVAYPEGAQVSIDGKSAGAAPLVQNLVAGEHKIRVEAAGYEPKEKTFKVLDGYQQQIILSLSPQGRGLAGTAGTDDPKTVEMFNRAVNAEARSQWEIAEAGYSSLIQSDAKFAPAYEHLANLQQNEGRNRDAMNTLLTMGSQTPATAHAYSLLANGFFICAMKGPGDGNTDTRRIAVGPFTTPSGKPGEAALGARRAADLAIKADTNSAEANRVLGLSYIAADKKGASKQLALSAFGKAAFLDPKDAANSYALGFGIRYFAQFLTGEAQSGELNRAVESLKQAISLRPDYYEAHRELAYCYHLLGQTGAAMQEYELANANRGAARDKDEVAGNSVALSSLHQERAKNETGDKQQRDQEASASNLDDAKETSGGNLQKAVGVLGQVGLSTQIRDYLPSELTRVLDLPGNITNQIQNKIPDVIKIPRGRFPF